MEEVVCPICDTDQARFWGREYKGHTIVKCSRCSLRYVNPRRLAEENTKIYDDENYFARMVNDQHDLGELENYFLPTLNTLLDSRCWNLFNPEGCGTDPKKDKPANSKEHDSWPTRKNTI